MDVNKPEWLEQMEGIFETLNEGVLIIDDCNTALYVNQSLSEMTGYAVEEIVGHGPGRFYQGEDLEFLLKQVRRASTEGQHRYEFFAPRKDGRRVPTILSTRAIEDPDGRVFTVVLYTDITQQKEAEEKLRDANSQLEKRQQEIDAELELASRVQQSLAPQGMRWGNLEVEAFYSPVQTIGGDFGLVTPIGDHHLNLLVCDVTGHGISSALIANRIYAETTSLLDRGAHLGEMFRRLNSFVVQKIAVSGFFFTMAVARFGQDGRHMHFASAGHPPAFWVAGSEVRRLDPRSAVLGCIDDAVAPEPEENITLDRGDRVVLYTDGFDEVFDQHGEMLGVKGLQEIVRQGARLPLAGLKDHILERVEAWRHGPITDDRSLVIVEVQ